MWISCIAVPLYKNTREEIITSEIQKEIKKVPVPPFDVQKWFVAEVEKEEEIIASNRRLIELMEGKIS